MINEKLNKTVLDLINNYIGEVIYENTKGDDFDIVCSKTITDYDYLRFDFLDQEYHTSIVAPIIDDKIQLFCIGVPDTGNTIQLIVQRYTINGKTLVYDGEGMVNFNNKTIPWQSYDTDLTTIRIKRVTGIKIK